MLSSGALCHCIVKERMQPLAVSSWNLKDPLVSGNHEQLASAVVNGRAATSLGISEQSARDKGLKFRTHHEITSSWYSSRRVAEDCSGLEVLIEEGTDRILGAHVVGAACRRSHQSICVCNFNERPRFGSAGQYFCVPHSRA